MDIHKFRELLESAQSDIESASYEMSNVGSTAQGAESEADDAASTISKLISEVVHVHAASSRSTRRRRAIC